MIQCIYCSEIKERHKYNVEHVIPKAFGRFACNLTLKCTVCSDCNQFFGDNLDVVLARDTYEGLSRYVRGIKSANAFKDSGKRLQLRTGAGPYAGQAAHLVPDGSGGSLVLQVRPQVGFKIGGESRYCWFDIDDIPSELELKSGRFDIDQPGSIVISGQVKMEEVQEALRSRGILFVRQYGVVDHEEGQPVDCTINVTLDPIVRRAVAKIAFNYVTYCCGRDLVNSENFDAARAYVRWGEDPAYEILEVYQNPPTVNHCESMKGHLVTACWLPESSTIMSEICLMNHVIYVVRLARGLEWKVDLRCAHFFDIVKRRVHALPVPG